MFSPSRKLLRGLPCLVFILIAQASPLVVAEDVASPPPLNRLAGRVWTAGKEAPVANTTVLVVDVKEGFLAYRGPTEIFVDAPEEKVLWFFSKPNEIRSATTVTDAEGHFTIDGLRHGKYHVLAVHPQEGLVILRDVEQPPSGTGLEIVLEPPTFLDGSIRGLSASAEVIEGVLDHGQDSIAVQIFDGAPPTVMIFTPRFSVAADGSFRVGPIPSGGEWSLTVHQPVPKRKLSVILLKLPVTLKPGLTNRFEFDRQKGAQVLGQVVGPGGEPLAEAAVRVRTADAEKPDGRMYGAITDADGRYAIGGIPDGDYQLDVKRWLPRTGFG